MATETILTLTIGIIIVIAILTVLALLNWRLSLTREAPAILTSLGIFGTFLGITVGLSGFDVNNISNSVPLLFSGIQLAFWTSVAGILGGLLVKFRQVLWPLADPAQSRRASIDDLVGAMRSVERSLADASQSPLLQSLRDLKEETASRAEDLKAALSHQLKSSSKATGEQLHGTTAAFENLRTALGGDSAQLIERMEAMRESSESLGKRLRDTLGANNEALAKALEGNRDAMAAQVTTAVTELRDALVGPDGAAALLGRQLQAGQVELAGAMAKSIAQMRETLGEDSDRLLERMESMREGSDTLGDRLTEVLGANQAAITAAMEGNRDAMAAQVTTAVTELRDALVGPDGAASTLGQQLQSGQLDLATALDRMADTLQTTLGETGSGLSADIGQLSTAMADAIDDLRLAIVGPEGVGAGLVSEMREAQGSTRESLEAIRTALEENTQRQVDYSPKQLLSVLEELIRQFNTQFAGQFWDKFDGFSQGIAELLSWMETYRKQLADMTEQQTRSTKNMDIATRRFDEIASRSEIFTDVARNISALLGGLDAQRVQIESHLKQFAHIVDVTRSNLEDIEQRIVEGNAGMNEHMAEISSRIEAQVHRLDSALEEELAKSMNSFGQQLAALSEKFVDDYSPLTDRLRDVVNLSRAV